MRYVCLPALLHQFCFCRSCPGYCCCSWLVGLCLVSGAGFRVWDLGCLVLYICLAFADVHYLSFVFADVFDNVIGFCLPPFGLCFSFRHFAFADLSPGDSIWIGLSAGFGETCLPPGLGRRLGVLSNARYNQVEPTRYVGLQKVRLDGIYRSSF